MPSARKRPLVLAFAIPFLLSSAGTMRRADSDIDGILSRNEPPRLGDAELQAMDLKGDGGVTLEGFKRYRLEAGE